MAENVFAPANVTMQNARTGAVPEEWANGIIEDMQMSSAFMQLAKQEQVTKPVHKMTVMSGVGAYWVDEANRIQTSKPTMLNITLASKKLGVIIPTTKENLAYSVPQFFEINRRAIATAFAKKLDQAAFSNIDNPFAFSVLESATAASNTITLSADVYDNLNDALGLIEENDHDPNGFAIPNAQLKALRGAKDSNLRPIFQDATASAPSMLLGIPAAKIKSASVTDGSVGSNIYVADWDDAYYGILKGIEYEVLTEATLTTIKDEDGNPVNLAERDMVALKATMEVGIALIRDDSFAAVLSSAVTP